MREWFVVEGEIPGVFPSSRVFELQAYDDGTLSGIVLNPEGDEEASDAKLLHGTAVRLSDKKARADGDDPQMHVYQVAFILVRAWSPTRTLEGGVKVIRIEGTLSRSYGFHAQWAERVDTFEFVLSIRQPRSDGREVTSDEHSLGPLAPGYYTLEGAALSASQRFYPTTCRVKLRAGGEMEGSSTDGGSVTPWEGSWSPTGIHFTLHGYSKKYIYDGKAHAHGLRGEWKASGVQSSSSGEQGTFDFEVVESCRAWSHSSHKYHPKVFRDIVRLCLLSSVQAREASGEAGVAIPRLPSDLWSEVFSYCEYDWFPGPSSPQTPPPDIPVPDPVSRLLAAYPGLFVVLLAIFLTVMDYV